MKILTCNAGYFLGYQNLLGGYLPPPFTSVFGDGETEQRKLDQFTSLIEGEHPDVVSLLEIDQGSHRTRTNGQFRSLIQSLQERGLSYAGEAANKYSADATVAALPFFGNLGNGVLARSPLTTIRHYLTAGRKRLVIEAELDPTVVLFVVHLSLRARTRTRQFRQLAALVSHRARDRDVIVTGDFNTFDAAGGLTRFAEETNLDVLTPGETIPARPLDDFFVASRTIDLFLCTPTIPITRCEVLDIQVSDHRPIILETAH